MDLLEAMKRRHSVRAYTDRPIEGDVKKQLCGKIETLNARSGLHMQLVCDEPKAFDCFMAHYGKFSGVRNYIAVAGTDSEDFQEKCGYYGEELVLFAQQLGLNTCWVALTYRKTKSAYTLSPGERLLLVIAIGYGQNQGKIRKSRRIEDVSNADEKSPAWFKQGVKAALLAPTAVNQQKFSFFLEGNTVKASSGTGFYTRVDLGIAKYHFEVAAGIDNFNWK